MSAVKYREEMAFRRFAVEGIEFYEQLAADRAAR